MELQTDVKIELGDTAEHQCACCGMRSETVHGFLYQPDGTTSVYFAGFTHGHPERRANMVLSVGGWGEGTTPADRRAIALQVSAQAGNIAFNFPPPESSPWFGKELLGRTVQADGVGDDERRWITRLAEVAVSQDQRIAAYFGGDRRA